MRQTRYRASAALKLMQLCNRTSSNNNLAAWATEPFYFFPHGGLAVFATARGCRPRLQETGELFELTVQQSWGESWRPCWIYRARTSPPSQAHSREDRLLASVVKKGSYVAAASG